MSQLQQHEQSLIRGGFVPLWGGFAQQNPGVLVSFNRLLNAHSFDTIIEIGTHTGGLSLLFALYCRMSKLKALADDPREPSLFVNQTHHKSPKRFFTFDNVERDKSVHRVLRDLGAFAFIQDALYDEKNIEGIREVIWKGGSTLLLCDGGNKKRELELYGGALKPGDFVMLHDWAHDRHAAAENARHGIWFSHETMWQDEVDPESVYPEAGRYLYGIKELCERYGIEQVYADEFNPVAWFAGRKS